MSTPVIIIINPPPQDATVQQAIADKTAKVDNTGFERAIYLLQEARENGAEVRIYRDVSP